MLLMIRESFKKVYFLKLLIDVHIVFGLHPRLGKAIVPTWNLHLFWMTSTISAASPIPSPWTSFFALGWFVELLVWWEFCLVPCAYLLSECFYRNQCRFFCRNDISLGLLNLRTSFLLNFIYGKYIRYKQRKIKEIIIPQFGEKWVNALQYKTRDNQKNEKNLNKRLTVCLHVPISLHVFWCTFFANLAFWKTFDIKFTYCTSVTPTLFSQE